MPVSVRYQFDQKFSVPANEAFKWCTTFDAGDQLLMGKENVERHITPLAAGTIILTDTFNISNSRVEKQKLVQLYPDHLFWTSTHLSGPNKYSQFLYVISAEDDNASHLDFTAFHLEYEKENLSKAQVKLLADKLCKEDAGVWLLLAQAMAKDLCK